MKLNHGERISIEKYNKELEKAESEFEKGEYIIHEAMLGKMKISYLNTYCT